MTHSSDSNERFRFKVLHTVSVLMTLGHIVATGWVLVRLV
jgi:hypothetical protein